MHFLPLPHLMQRYLPAGTPLRSVLRFLPLLVHENLCFIGCGLSSSRSFHSSSKQRKQAPYCKAAHTSSLSLLLNSSCPCPCHKSFIPNRSFFGQLVRFLITFREKLLKLRHILFVLLCAVRFDMFDFDQYFLVKQYNSSQILIHKSASQLSDRCTSFLLSRAHLWLLYCRHAPWWANNFFEKTNECRQLSPLDGTLDLKFGIHCAVHPMHRPHLLIIIQLHHCPATCFPLSSGTQK